MDSVRACNLCSKPLDWLGRRSALLNFEIAVMAGLLILGVIRMVIAIGPQVQYFTAPDKHDERMTAFGIGLLSAELPMLGA